MLGWTRRMHLTAARRTLPTVATGVGIVVLGLAAEDRFCPGRAQAGDAVLCVGVPKSAPYRRVVSDDPEILRPGVVRALAALETVNDILPVGSRGVLAEAHDLANSTGLSFVQEANPVIDLAASGGPGTCCVVAIPPKPFRRCSPCPIFRPSR